MNILSCRPRNTLKLQAGGAAVQKKKMGKDLLITSHQTSKCTSEDLFVQNF